MNVALRPIGNGRRQSDAIRPEQDTDLNLVAFQPGCFESDWQAEQHDYPEPPSRANGHLRRG